MGVTLSGVTATSRQEVAPRLPVAGSPVGGPRSLAVRPTVVQRRLTSNHMTCSLRHAAAPAIVTGIHEAVRHRQSGGSAPERHHDRPAKLETVPRTAGSGAGSRLPDGGGGTSTAALARLVRPGCVGRANFLAVNRHRATVFSNGRNHPRWGDTRSPARTPGSETASSTWSAVRSTTSVGPKGTRVTASERPSSRHDRGAVTSTPSNDVGGLWFPWSTPSPRTLDHHRSSTRPSPRLRRFVRRPISTATTAPAQRRPKRTVSVSSNMGHSAPPVATSTVGSDTASTLTSAVGQPSTSERPSVNTEETEL